MGGILGSMMVGETDVVGEVWRKMAAN